MSACANGICAYGRQFVGGFGDTGAPFLLIGEAPGYYELQQGRPFVGRAGKKLNEILAAVGIDRETECSFINTVCCVELTRKPAKPTPEEIISCDTRFWTDISEHDCELIICLGATAASKLFPGVGISEIRGKFRAVVIGDRTYTAISTYHPSAILRGRPEYQALVMEDLRRARRYVG